MWTERSHSTRVGGRDDVVFARKKNEGLYLEHYVLLHYT